MPKNLESVDRTAWLVPGVVAAIFPAPILPGFCPLSLPRVFNK
jgi:hypothetical protein